IRDFHVTGVQTCALPISPTTEFTQDPQADLNPEPLIAAVRSAAGADHTWTLNAHEQAFRYFGDSIMANMMMLGFAWQHGGIPLRSEERRVGKECKSRRTV